MPKILIVEDEKILRDAYEILLNSQESFEVDTAPNGAEALELCRQNSYNLILLDLMMPIMDGITFLRELNLGKNAPNTRVVIMSNISSGKEIVDALDLGAHRHAVKSDLAPNEVMSIVNAELSFA